MSENTPILSAKQWDALVEVEGYSASGSAPFWWRQSSMHVLRQKGLVYEWHPANKLVKNMAHRITDAGRAALKARRAANMEPRP